MSIDVKAVGSLGLKEGMCSDILLENSEMLQIKGATVFTHFAITSLT